MIKLAGTKEQDLGTNLRPFAFQLKIVKEFIIRQNFPDQRAQIGNVPLAALYLIQQLPLGISWRGPEELIKRLIGALNTQLRVKDKQRLPDSLHDRARKIAGKAYFDIPRLQLLVDGS